MPPRKQNQIVPIDKYRLGEDFFEMHDKRRSERRAITKLGYPIILGKSAKVYSLSEISEESLEQSSDAMRDAQV